MSKSKELDKLVKFRCPKEILNKWDARAKYIGIDRVSLIMVGMNEYLESHPGPINKKPIMNNQQEKGIKDHTRKAEKVDGRKTRKEPVECPTCHEFIKITKQNRR